MNHVLSFWQEYGNMNTCLLEELTYILWLLKDITCWDNFKPLYLENIFLYSRIIFDTNILDNIELNMGNYSL